MITDDLELRDPDEEMELLMKEKAFRNAMRREQMRRIGE